MYILIQVLLQHVPIGSLNNTPAVVHKMWCYQSLYLHKGKNKSKSKKPLFIVGLCKEYKISYHLKWVLVAHKSMHISKIQQNTCDKSCEQR